MKKVIALIFCLGVFSALASASATDYTVAVSTYPIDEAATMAADISGNIAIEQISIFNLSTTTAQTVSIYKNCSSTTTVSLIWRGYIPAGESSRSIFLNFLLYNTPLSVTDVCFRKSDAASVVQFNVHYR